MWNYEKRLQYPINIKNCNPTLAAMIISQYGGPDGELGASMRYLSQRYSMPYREVAGLLTDIGTEELGHLEMVSTMVHQLTRNLTPEEIESKIDKADYHRVGETTAIVCSLTLKSGFVVVGVNPDRFQKPVRIVNLSINHNSLFYLCLTCFSFSSKEEI